MLKYFIPVFSVFVCLIDAAEFLPRPAELVERESGIRLKLARFLERADRIIDLVYDGDVFTDYAVDRVAGRHTHGTGCAFSAALASHLAIGRSLHEAIPLAQEYVAGAIRHAPGLGRGAGPMRHFWRLDIDKAGRL